MIIKLKFFFVSLYIYIFKFYATPQQYIWKKIILFKFFNILFLNVNSTRILENIVYISLSRKGNVPACNNTNNNYKKTNQHYCYGISSMT